VTQGELVIPAKSGNPAQSRKGKVWAKGSKQSYEGIVAKKLAGKAAMASDPARS
jgi:hypothetical protein